MNSGRASTVLSFSFSPMQVVAKAMLRSLFWASAVQPAATVVARANSGEVRFAGIKSFNDHTELVEMKFSSRLGLDVFGTNCIMKDMLSYILKMRKP